MNNKTSKSVIIVTGVSLISWAIAQGPTTIEGITGIVIGLGIVFLYEILQEEQVKDSYSDLVNEIGEERFKEIAEDLSGEIRNRK